MAELKCGVDSCSYNKEKCCCKGDIMVGGKHADCCNDTCCESFAQKKDYSYTSSLEHPCRTISIVCEAVKCVYNSNYKCHAEHVDIKGGGANSSAGTECSTFKKKKKRSIFRVPGCRALDLVRRLRLTGSLQSAQSPGGKVRL